MTAQRTEKALDSVGMKPIASAERPGPVHRRMVAERERQGKDAGIAQREKREDRQGSSCCEGYGFARNKDKKSLKDFKWKIMLNFKSFL